MAAGRRRGAARTAARAPGAALDGGGAAARRGGRDGDLLAETATVITASGAVAVFSVSSAPRIAVRLGGRLHGELGGAARVGIVRMRGEALPGSRLAGTSQVGLWLGPAADIAVGVDVMSRLLLRASAEFGVVITGVIARDFGVPVAALTGTWTSLGLAAAVEL